MKMAHCFICVFFSMPAILRPSQKRENDIWYRAELSVSSRLLEMHLWMLCVNIRYPKSDAIIINMQKRCYTMGNHSYTEIKSNKRLTANKPSSWLNAFVHRMSSEKIIMHSIWFFTADFHLSKNKPPALRSWNSNSILILWVHVKHTNDPLYGRTRLWDNANGSQHTI